MAYYIPVARRTKRGSYLHYDVPLFAVAIIGVGWFSLSSATGAGAEQGTAAVLLAASVLLVCPSVFKPFNFEHREQKKNSRDVKITIKTKVTIGFLLLAVIFIAFIGVTVYNSQTGSDTLTRWSSVYRNVGIAINLIFAMAIGFLWYVERNIVNPLEMLSDGAKAFAARPAGTDEILEPDFLKINTGDEIALMARSFNTMMRDITAYMRDLKTVTAEKERIGAELNVATNIQASMLPCIFPPFPERPEFDIYATMQPAKEVGGDFYDFFLVDENHLAVVIADVSGKGVPAALFMVIAKTLIKNRAQNREIPADVFTGVNAQLYENNEEGMFVTAWMGVLDIAGGEFTYVNAGHNPPLLKRKDGEFEYLKARPGFVLAGLEGVKYRQNDIRLEPGDILYLYTDGVTEATDTQGELYGETRLKIVLDRTAARPLGDILRTVKADIDTFAKGAPQFDDITMLALKIM
ncbi:MAG: SpoIIE family protein phosphatase [Dehalobacterium sp.]